MVVTTGHFEYALPQVKDDQGDKYTVSVVDGNITGEMGDQVKEIVIRVVEDEDHNMFNQVTLRLIPVSK